LWVLILIAASGASPASAAQADCAGLAAKFEARLALLPGAADEDGNWVLLRREADLDLHSCPDLEPQRYFVVRMAELGYPAVGSRRGDAADATAMALAEDALRKHPDSARIATIVARLSGSIESARRATALDPSYGPARTALAAALAASDNAAAAIATVPGDPSSLSAAALIERARIKLAAGDAHGALADSLACGRAPSGDPEPTPGRDRTRDCEELLGFSLTALGREGQAKKHFEAAAALGSARARQALSSGASPR
jgi:hypothetical protein